MELDPDLGCRVWFWAIALVVGLLQGVRGIFLQRDVVRTVNAERTNTGPPPLSRADAIFGRQVPDFILNFWCTIAGFAALAAIARILDSVVDLSQIDLGAGVFLSAMLFVAVAGIAGILPWILSRTTYPGGKA